MIYNNTNVSAESGIEEEDSGVTRRALVGSILSLLIVWTLLGNLTVCLAVFRFRHLRHKVTNIFIVSLALSDLLVAVLVMPWRAVTEVAGFWPFGAFCNTWLACDIMCSTASILNLCMISVDRYWAISSPFSYERSMNRRVAAIMIAVTWTVSVVISFVPVQLNWHRRVDVVRDLPSGHNNTTNNNNNNNRTLDGVADDGDHQRLLLGNCDTRLSRTYAISSSLISFYIPVAIMIVTYTRIYGIAQLQIRRISSLERAAEHARNCRSDSDASARSPGDDDLSGLSSPPPQLNAHNHNHNHHYHPRRLRSHSLYPQFSYPHAATTTQSHRALKVSIRKETKVLKTLSIIMGVFVFCWFPFFVLNCALPFCPSGEESGPDATAGPHCVSETTFDIFVWFGWSNSSLNPIIYAFNADFRDAFLRLLGCRSSGGGSSKGGRWVSGAAAEWTGGGVGASNDHHHHNNDTSSLNNTEPYSGVASSCCVNSRGSRDSSGTITVSLFYNSSRDQVVMMDTLDNKAYNGTDTTTDRQTELPV